jgi:hypothetical protein
VSNDGLITSYVDYNAGALNIWGDPGSTFAVTTIGTRTGAAINVTLSGTSCGSQEALV